MADQEEIKLEDLIQKFNAIQKYGAEIVSFLRKELPLDSQGQKPPFVLDDNERKKIADTFESLMSCFALFKNLMSQQMIAMEKEVQEIREREGEWKKLVDLFGEYKEKTGGEVEQLRKALKDFKAANSEMATLLRKEEAENRELRDQVNTLKDVFIRMSAVQRRKANLERIQKEIEDDERRIRETLATFKFE
jgi:hypothetical protein